MIRSYFDEGKDCCFLWVFLAVVGEAAALRPLSKCVVVVVVDAV